jgi:hypothetical protein
MLSLDALCLEFLPHCYTCGTEYHELGVAYIWVRHPLLHVLLHFRWEEGLHPTIGEGAEIFATVRTLKDANMEVSGGLDFKHFALCFILAAVSLR